MHTKHKKVIVTILLMVLLIVSLVACNNVNNEQTQQNELKEVVRLYRYEKTEIVRVGTSDGQIISATTEHPFYVVNQGWFAAKDLRAGDILLLVNGKTVIVELVQHELLESPIIVYNFEVADNHNYYVAESVYGLSDAFVLVHNTCATYYEATRTKDGVAKGVEITKKQALNQVRNGNDVLVSSRSAAKSLAKSTFAKGKVIEEISKGTNYLKHFHDIARIGGHIFFG